MLYPFTLHDGWEELSMEVVGRVSQLVDKVAIPCCCLAGDDSDVQAEERQRELLLQVEDAFVLELTDNLLAAACHIP